MAAVGIHNVTKSFGATSVLHGVPVEIEDGGFVVPVGPSGCGKSTLPRKLAWLENISGGRVVNKVPPQERDTAMVCQN